MSVLRVYDPDECDTAGVPLGWEECPTCHGSGTILNGDCAHCDGHGSLIVAARKGRREMNWSMFSADTFLPYRCEDCCHPMSDGAWVGDVRGPVSIDKGARLSHVHPDDVPDEEWTAMQMRAVHERVRRDFFPFGGAEDRPGLVTIPAVHYSRCDGRCTHRGPGRTHDPLDLWCTTHEVMPVEPTPEWVVEASWRPVEVRPLGWPHDLRPEKLAMLCLRCWATRGMT